MSKFYNISTDNTLGGENPSDITVASQKAIKEYVDNVSGTNLIYVTLTGSSSSMTAKEIYEQYLAGNIIMCKPGITDYQGCMVICAMTKILFSDETTLGALDDYGYIEFAGIYENAVTGGKTLYFVTCSKTVNDSTWTWSVSDAVDIDKLPYAILRTHTHANKSILDGIPSSLGTSGQVLCVNSSEDGLQFSSLATVATSGSYNDLDNTPTIPDAVSGTNDGTNWTSLTIGTVTKGLAAGGGLTSYDFTHTSNASATSPKTITFAANQRCSIMLTVSANITLNFICNNLADNYVWIKNASTGDIEVLINSFTLNGTSLSSSNIWVPSDGITVPSGNICELGIIANSDGAFITSRMDLAVNS